MNRRLRIHFPISLFATSKYVGYGHSSFVEACFDVVFVVDETTECCIEKGQGFGVADWISVFRG